MTTELDIRDLIPDVVEAVGAFDFDDRGSGISPRRLPSWTRPQLPQFSDIMARMPSGVRLRFATDSRRVGIAFLATTVTAELLPRRPVVFNLETGDGTLSTASSVLGNNIRLDLANPGRYEVERGDADTLVFEGLDEGTKTCELWLPHNAYVELRGMVVDGGATLEPAPADTRPRWIHHGSSISHCMEADEPALIWPAVAARAAGMSLISLGFGGQSQLDQFVARTMRDAPADIVTVKVGINIVNMDSMRERVFGPALHGFLDTLREGKPDTPIAAISPIYCPSAETRPGPTVPDGNGKFITVDGFEEYRVGCLTLTRIRELIAEAVETRRSAGDAALHYVDGLELFGAEDADDLPDDLHPNPAGYVRMGERFAPILRRLMG
ncbi:MAG: lipase [Gammaproteobacteria bacterium]|nr:lipase [Gammaproteobacteria bacterium]